MTPHLLWPPNHQMRPVTITGVADPDGEAVTLVIDSIAQDEPVNDADDGNTSPDALVQGLTVLLRAERAGSGNGRVYRVGFAATDPHGAACEGEVVVGVPINFSRDAAPVDDGTIYDSTHP